MSADRLGVQLIAPAWLVGRVDARGSPWHNPSVQFAWVGKTVGDLEVRAVVYHASSTSLSALVVHPDGTAQPEILGEMSEFLPTIDSVADELQRTTDVARGAVPALREFAANSGRGLLPRSITSNPPDILLIVPHSVLHGVPVHLVHTDSGEPLCTVAGVSYASSLSQFVQCVSGNPARARELDSWHLALEPRPSERQVAGYCADVLDRSGTRFGDVVEAIQSALGHAVLGEGNRSSVKGHIDPWNTAGPGLDALVMVAHGYIDSGDHQLSGLLMASTDLMIPGHHGDTFRSVTLLDDQPALYSREAPMTLPPPELQIARYAEVLSIAEMRMDALSKVPLVALLGCSAGWSRVLKGDVPSSLGETFLTLGSSAVIAPGWAVHVTATARWAGHFFHAWSRLGWPVALSGTYATRALYEDSSPVERYGAITVRGDWL